MRAMVTAAAETGTPRFGDLLRYWRVARRLSQLTLATEAEISSRHLSFLETGRAQPSREMVLLLAGVLDVPLREQNALLTAAGYAAIHRETALGAPELSQVRRALGFILAQQEPFPALVVDRHWNVLMQNEGAGRVFGLFLDREAVPGPPNVVRLTFHPQALRRYIVNWEALAGPLIQQIHREAVGGIPDEGTRRLLDEVLSYPGVPARWRTPDATAQSAPFLALALRKGDLALRFFSTIASLGTPQDVTLQELRVECFFPGDDTTEAVARRLAAK
ncbi:MAG TPA: helix-turn-helix transcriptional regulator [Methylomirabilota bacterium]|nr:helix-turn-helix transcriptional regulator [Methylomirabilota bacterium]